MEGGKEARKEGREGGRKEEERVYLKNPLEYFLFFCARGRGRGKSEVPGGGGRFLLKIPGGGGGGLRGERGGGEGPGRCPRGFFWRGAKYFFSGPKCPPRLF